MTSSPRFNPTEIATFMHPCGTCIDDGNPHPFYGLPAPADLKALADPRIIALNERRRMRAKIRAARREDNKRRRRQEVAG